MPGAVLVLVGERGSGSTIPYRPGTHTHHHWNPCHGFRRAWAVLRHEERREVNLKKVPPAVAEEGLHVRVHSSRKRAGVSSAPQVAADAPKVMWALNFQFDSTIDGKAIKIASMTMNTPGSRCWIWWNARSPPSGSSPN